MRPGEWDITMPKARARCRTVRWNFPILVLAQGRKTGIYAASCRQIPLFSINTLRVRWRQRLIGVASLLVAAAVVLAGGAVGAWAETGVGSWSATGAMPLGWAGEDGGSVVTLADGRVLAVAGGVHGVQVEPRATELYDPVSGTWTEGPELPVAEGLWMPWTLVALAEGGALLFGEAQCSGEEKPKCVPATSAYLLDSSGSHWSKAAPMRQARAEPVAVRLEDGRVLVAGGFSDECPFTSKEVDAYSCVPLSSAEVYDPTSNEWSPIAPMPQARAGAVGALLSDGTVLVVGGDEANDAIRYDPSSGIWTAAGQTASSRTGSLLFPLSGDRALALGGEVAADFFGSTGDIAYDRPQLREEPTCSPAVSSELFAVPSDWLVSSPEPAGGESCTLRLHGAGLAGGQILIETGTAPPNSFYVLDAEQRCWSATAAPIEPREEGTVTAMPNGRALVFGGYGNGHWLGAEIYTPGSPTCAPPASVGPLPGLPSSAPPPFSGATIARSKHLTVTEAGSVRVLVQCPASAAGRCVGQVQFSLLAATSTRRVKSGDHARHLFLGSAPFAAAAGRTAWVTVRVTDHKGALRALIRRWRRAAVVVTTTAHDNTGQAVTTSASETLRRPRG